jgi:UDP-N-acetyl-D-galactosamine dehydrogenase
MSLEMMLPADAVVFAVPHSSYVVLGWSAVAPLLKNGRGLVIDVKATLDREQRPKDIELWRL